MFDLSIVVDVAIVFIAFTRAEPIEGGSESVRAGRGEGGVGQSFLQILQPNSITKSIAYTIWSPWACRDRPRSESN